MSEQDEQVYWVPLTEAERELILDTPPARGPNSPLWPVYSGLTAKLESARPERPERREALEELAEAARHLNIYFDDPDWIVASDASRFMAARERLRALEGK